MFTLQDDQAEQNHKKENACSSSNHGSNLPSIWVQGLFGPLQLPNAFSQIRQETLPLACGEELPLKIKENMLIKAKLSSKN